MDYDLFRLNSRSFEQLVQVLAAKVLGQGTIIFGDGPDGGREATFQGPVPYPNRIRGWDGYGVVQAKFRQRTQGTTADGQWALAQLRRELKRYEEEGLSRRVPEYLIFATNVTVTPVEERGVKDQMLALAEKAIARATGRGGGALRGFDVWDYDKIRVYLDQFEDVRRAFGAYVSAGDVLAETISTLREIRTEVADFDEAMSRFLQKELLADRWANLEQAGRAADEQVPVSRVFVDLPAFQERLTDPPEESGDDLKPGFLSEVLATSSRRLDRRTLADVRPRTQRADQEAQPGDGRLVLVGGPGQGKSTLGQFACQMFRAALLRTRPKESLSEEAEDALVSLESDLRKDGLALPEVRRFPLRVVLSRFAASLADPEGADSLLEYLARLISRRVPGKVTPRLLSTWLGQYPCLLVLDGLDEVPASSNRAEVMEAISDFWVDAAQANADCLVVATTRPQGYGEEFSPRYYRHLWLAPISSARALAYTDRLLAVRFGSNVDRRDSVGERLRLAASRPETARLMTTPLQATIMATLLERMGEPPSGRWNLFSQYYRTIYDREVERGIPAASVLRDYKPEIDAIHWRVGLLLQVEAERADQVDPKISRERFERIVVTRLREEGHDVDESRDLVEKIIEAAMFRLVFLVGVQADQIGFELRSFQEFMAAEALLRGSEPEEVRGRLRAIGSLPVWRNVFLFAAGRCFAEIQQWRTMIHGICAELDDPESELGAAVVMPGARLALDLLDDGMARNQPLHERLLAREALRLLRRPPEEWHDRLAAVYHPGLAAGYEAELRAAVGATPFAATLGAWRTLAGMVARSIEWAAPMLRERLPESDDLGLLLEALPGTADSAWLRKTLADLCLSSPPYASLPYIDSLRRLGLLEEMPSWFRQLAEARPAAPEGGSGRYRFMEDGESKVAVVMRPVETLQGFGSQHRLASVPKVWRPLVAGLGFGASPSAGTLARALEQMLEVEDFHAVKMCKKRTPWPLGSLVAAAESRQELGRLAQMARDRRFGNFREWRDAERRWARGVSVGELSHPSRGALPYDASVGLRGFPLGAATGFSIEHSAKTSVEFILGWLPEISHLPARQFTMQSVLVMLDLVASDLLTAEGESDLIDAASLVEDLREGDLDTCETVGVGGLNRVDWDSPLPPPQVRFLDEVGCRLEQAPTAEPLSPVLRSALLDAWLEDEARVGLYRLLAVGWPLLQRQEGKEHFDRLLEHPPPGAEAERALLGLRLRGVEDLRPDDLRTIAEAGRPWVERAIRALDVDEGFETLARLDGLMDPRLWPQREVIAGLLEERAAQRPSGLRGQVDEYGVAAPSVP